MPLIAGDLIAGMLTLTDATDPNFVRFPVGTPEEINTIASENWAGIVSSFLSTLVAPPGIGAIMAGAEPLAAAAMKVALEAGTSGLPELIDAFGLAAVVGLPVFAIVPGTFSLTPLPPIADPTPPATSFELDVTTWAAAGMFTPPAGSPTPWS